MSRITFALIAASTLAFTSAQAAPGDISVAEYLKAWDAMDGAAIQKELNETGKIDFSNHPEAKIVSEKIGQTAKAYRDAHEADRAAGRTPKSCLPEGEANLSTDVLIPHLQSYDVGKRAQVTLAQAFADLMAKTYPCK